MSTLLSIGYLTGSARVIKNSIGDDLIIWRKRRTIGQMFLAPYESKEEFIYCARHTLMPIANIGLAILNPNLIITTPLIIGALTIACHALSAISELCGSNSNASFFLNTANYFIKDLCQLLIDIVVLPISALAMLTRGISTGLHAAGICGERNEGLPLAPT